MTSSVTENGLITRHQFSQPYHQRSGVENTGHSLKLSSRVTAYVLATLMTLTNFIFLLTQKQITLPAGEYTGRERNTACKCVASNLAFS